MVKFIVIFIIIYALLNYYVAYNGWLWLKTTRFHAYKKTYILLIILLSFSYIIGQATHVTLLTIIGSYWLIIFAYSLILFPIANIYHYIWKKRSVFVTGIILLSIYAVMIGLGSFNAWNPTVREYSIKIEKEADELSDLRIVMAADFHLGQIVGNRHLERFISRVSDLEPDMILLPGDIIDDFIEPYLKNNMGETMRQLKAPLGVYAVMGNHEYYGDQLEEIYETLKHDGIQMLMDETILVENEIYLAGRLDLTDTNRKSIEELVSQLDHKKPILMLDHQPTELIEAAEQGVDLIVSGHTHGGQIFPANFITNRLFENDWGYLQVGEAHSIVTSGFGTWGPPIRIGTRSEIVMIHVQFVKG